MARTSPDIFIVKPVFWQDQHVAFAVSTAHHLDMGGRLPGSSACDNTEIFQDGLRIPWLKLYRRGPPDEAIFTLIRANVRVPEMTIGDIRAQLAACHIGEQAIHDLIRRYGLETFTHCAAALIDYTERLMRAEIATWPDSSYTFTDYLDSDGVSGPPTKIQVTLTVAGDGITADFTGSAPQVRGALNSTLSFTASVVALCVRSVLQVDIERYGLLCDSGGAGQFRGGLAIEREWQLLTSEAHLAIRSDRRDHLPYGLYGGQPGTPSINILYPKDDDASAHGAILPTRISTSLKAGERIYHKQAGGGGWGAPGKRLLRTSRPRCPQRQNLPVRRPRPLRRSSRSNHPGSR